MRPSIVRLVSLLALATLATLTAPAGPARAQAGQLESLRVDTRFAAVPLEALISGGPGPNGIPPLGFSADAFGLPDTRPARFESLLEARGWVGSREPVILTTVGGESGIFPLQVLTWHEIANLELGGVPLAVTFCPLCNTAIVASRRVPLPAGLAARLGPQRPAVKPQRETVLVTFGVSGLLYNSDLVMFDSATHTLWSQALGEAIVGSLTGARLKLYPSQIVSFAEAARSAPRARVLSRHTGYTRPYGTNPYVGYDDVNSPPFLYRGETDGRLPPKERVVTVSLGGEHVA